MSFVPGCILLIYPAFVFLVYHGIIQYGRNTIDLDKNMGGIIYIHHSRIIVGIRILQKSRSPLDSLLLPSLSLGDSKGPLQIDDDS